MSIVSNPQKAIPPAPQSNQNAGVGEHPCAYCLAWNAAYWASVLDVSSFPPGLFFQAEAMKDKAIEVLARLAKYAPEDCKKGCKRSREIHKLVPEDQQVQP
jgi:hypothetical protein